VKEKERKEFKTLSVNNKSILLLLLLSLALQSSAGYGLLVHEVS
jgi:hypothetical protein